MAKSIKKALEPEVPKFEEISEEEFELLEPEEKIEYLQNEVKSYKLENVAQKRTIEHYKINGPLRMYYALVRKLNEQADVLDSHRLTALNLGDGTDKTYDRLKSMWNDSTSLSSMVMELRKISAATDNEEKDMLRSFDLDEHAKRRQQ